MSPQKDESFWQITFCPSLTPRVLQGSQSSAALSPRNLPGLCVKQLSSEHGDLYHCKHLRWQEKIL